MTLNVLKPVNERDLKGVNERAPFFTFYIKNMVFLSNKNMYMYMYMVNENLDIKQSRKTDFHPQCDGQAEAMV